MSALFRYAIFSILWVGSMLPPPFCILCSIPSLIIFGGEFMIAVFAKERLAIAIKICFFKLIVTVIIFGSTFMVSFFCAELAYLPCQKKPIQFGCLAYHIRS